MTHVHGAHACRGITCQVRLNSATRCCECAVAVESDAQHVVAPRASAGEETVAGGLRRLSSGGVHLHHPHLLPLDSSPGLLAASMGGWKASGFAHSLSMRGGASAPAASASGASVAAVTSDDAVRNDGRGVLGMSHSLAGGHEPLSLGMSFAATASRCENASGQLLNADLLSLSFASGLSGCSPRDKHGGVSERAAGDGSSCPIHQALRGALPAAGAMRLGTRAVFADHPDVKATAADAAPFQLLDCFPAAMADRGAGAPSPYLPL